MKKILSILTALLMVVTMSAANLSGKRIYVNPGHGSFGPNDRPFATIPYPNLPTTGMPDTCGFYESNTNLWKCLYLRDRLVAAGATVVMSREECGPWPYTKVNGDYPDYSWDDYQNLSDYTMYNKPLSVVSEEVESGDYDLFISIHSNTSTDGAIANYPILFYRGHDEDKGGTSDYEITCRNILSTIWPWRQEIFESGLEYESNYKTQMNIRGDIDFYGMSSSRTSAYSGKTYTGYLLALKHGCVGGLIEGYFHTYQPARHRALNKDYCKMEGYAYYRGIIDYFGADTDTKGYILGVIKDKHDTINNSLYHYATNTHDQWMPINGAVVSLYKSNVKIAEYNVDSNYNGIFYFGNLDPGDDYTLDATCIGYKSLKNEYKSPITIEANKVAYPRICLEKNDYEPVVYSGTCGENLTWYLNAEDSTLTITGEGAMFNWPHEEQSPWYDYRSYIKDIRLPNGLTNIGISAFYDCENILSVEIPENVEYVGDKAFTFCHKLKSVNIPNSVRIIRNQSFYECNELSHLTLGNHVDSIGFGAFYRCVNLTKIEFPNSLTYIGGAAAYGGAFGSCTGLTEITFGNSLKTIDEFAFAHCSGLTSIDIPSSVTTISYCAFKDCSNLESITCKVATPLSLSIYGAAGEGVFAGVNKSIPLYVPAESVEAYKAADQWKDFASILPISEIFASGTCGAEGDNLTWELSNDSVLTITGTGVMADYADGNAPWFNQWEKIKSVIINYGVTSIGNYAFESCRNLNSVTIPNSITNIGENAFQWCTDLISIEIPNSVTSIGKEAFNYCYCLTSVSIPNSVTSIGDEAFSMVPNIIYNGIATGSPWRARSLNGFVDGLLVYSDATKSNILACSGQYIGELELASSVTNIGWGAFAYCEKLTSVIIPHGVTSIGDGAFNDCFRLANVSIPNTVTRIGNSAFYWCKDLTSIEIPNSVTYIGSEAFALCGLTSITCYAIIPPTLESRIESNIEFSTPLYVPAESVEAYSNAPYWQDYINIRAIGSDALNPDNPQNPGDYQLTLNVSDDVAGTVTGAGLYPQGTEVTITATANTGYTFTQWSDGVTDASRSITLAKDSTLTAVFTINRYTITFVDEDGTTVLASNEYDYGTTPVVPADPTKAATAQYTYTFAGWSPNVAAVTGDATYTATYSQTVNKYTVTFVEEDGTTVLASDEYDYGATPVAPADPTKAATAQYTYTFAGWSPSVAAVTGDATYTATYSQTVNKYSVTFVDEDGTTVLASDEYDYGTTPVAPANPTKAATAQYTYTFAGWSPSVATVTGDATYTATYSQTVNKYTVTFVDEDGTTVLASDEYDYGATPVAPANPTKAATAQYTYTFAGWSPSVATVTGDATYTATYSQTVNKYTITFMDEDGTTVLASAEYEYGATPVAPADPTKAATAQYTYTFNGWSPAIATVTEAATYTATYSQTVKKYTITFVDEDGTTVLASAEYEYGATPVAPADPSKTATAQYTYTFTGWSPEIVDVTSAATYTATYTATLIACTISGEQNLSDLEVGESTHITIDANGSLVIDAPTTIGELTLTLGGETASQVTGIENLTASTVDAILTVTAGQWYAFGVPFEVNVATGIRINGANAAANYGTDYVLDEYDGALRASAQDGWKRVAASATLHPGTLYMIYAASATTWRLTAANPAAITEASSVAVAANASTIGDHHAGWNGIANTRWSNSSASLNGVNYATLYNNQYSVYEVVQFAEKTFIPAEPFFVQTPAAGNVLFAADNASPAPWRVAPTEMPIITVALTNETQTFTDKAYISAAQDKPNTYMIGHDLEKMQASEPVVPQLWLEAYNMHLAAYEASLTGNEQIIPLGLYAPQNGTYTISLSDVPTQSSVQLTLNGQTVCDLTNSLHPLTLTAGTTAGYALHVTYDKEVVTNITPATSSSLAPQKLIENELLVILLPDGTRYSATGVKVE